MNQASQVLTTLIHYNVAVRDTMEYCLSKQEYDVNLFKEKKRSVLVEVEEHTPLKDIIEHSGENGEKLEKAIREFYDEIYGDNSTVLHLAEDGLRVDHNQHLAIYRHVLPIHENVTSMIRGILQDAHTKNIDVAEAEKVQLASDKMFRAVAYLTLVGDLNRLFDEYNQARKDAGGAESPASKFIGNDISTVIQHINFVRGNCRLTDAVYKNMEDKISALMEMMTGRRDLPVGKNFPDVMREAIETINLYIRDAEAAFRACYPQLIQELLDQVKADQEARTQAPTPAAPEA